MNEKKLVVLESHREQTLEEAIECVVVLEHRLQASGEAGVAFDEMFGRDSERKLMSVFARLGWQTAVIEREKTGSYK